MTIEWKVAFWAVVLVLLGAALWLFSGILLPFVAGMGLAYLLNPLIERLERLGIGRAIGALIVITAAVLAVTALVLILIPVLFNQLSNFIDNVPAYLRRLQQFASDPSRPWLAGIVGNTFQSGDKSAGEIVGQASGYLTAFAVSLWSGGTALVSVASLVVITPVVAFYFIVDWPRMIATLDSWIPPKHRDTVRRLAREIDSAMSGFMRGQTLVCVLLGSFYAIALTLLGLNFGILIGIVSGIIGFIPYVGSIVGFLMALTVALAQFWPEWTWIAAVVGVFLFGQFIEGNVLQPKLMGDRVGLHPLWLMFALLAFGYLFGFLGLLLAVPAAAAIGVLMRFAIAKYMESPIYTGQEPR